MTLTLSNQLSTTRPTEVDILLEGTDKEATKGVTEATAMVVDILPEDRGT